MLQDTLTPRYSPPRTRRSYSPQFKAHLVDVCERPGASVAALAREHGINANILHRWRKEHRQRMQSSDEETARVDHLEVDIDTRATTAMPSRAQTGAVVVNSTPAFVAIDLGSPPALRAAHAARPHEAPIGPAASPQRSPTPPDIRIECRHHGTQITVHWPIAAASECTRWLQELLR
ncbi:MAG: transposase [Comamonas sp.]